MIIGKVHQSSQMVSKFRSLLFSAPQTLHLFLLSREPNPPPFLEPSVSNDPRRKPSDPVERIRSSLSASMAASSASGESGIVSSEEMDGLRDRADVGVEGTLELVSDVVRW